MLRVNKRVNKVVLVCLIVALLLVVCTASVSAGQYDKEFYRRVAARAAGEASFSMEAFAAVVCTIKNRLRAGWTSDTVLSAYYAPDVKPTNEQIAVAWEVLSGHRHCNPHFYFCLGFVDKWRPGTHLVGVIQTPDGRKGIRLFAHR